MGATNRTELTDAIDTSFDRLEAKLDQRLAEMKAELIKWMFLFWAGSVVANKLIP